MFRIILILLAVGALVWGLGWIRRQSRVRLIEEMGSKELVDAVIRREISILEVPQRHRNEVDGMLKEIQDELER